MNLNSSCFSFLPKDILEQKVDKSYFPFSPKIFWDTPIKNIDMELHKNFIIERIFCRGLMVDLYFMIKIYSKEEIRDAVIKSKNLDKKTANWCSILYNIPKNEMHASSYYS
jgi:hypothetical protein